LDDGREFDVVGDVGRTPGADVMLVVGIDMGVVDVTVAVVIGVGPMDDIAVVELVAELIVE
jgi:hypothetical protein